MSIFSIGTNVIFLEKPEWLDTFKQNHNNIEYDYHVTLKQPCRITEEGIGYVKEKLSTYFKDSNKKNIPIVFDNLISDDSEVDENDGCIMILAENNQIINLQKEILHLLRDYEDYIVPKTEEYEKNFRPHITIADNLNREKFDLAKADLKHNCVLRGMITKVILSIVHEDGKEEIVFELTG